MLFSSFSTWTLTHDTSPLNPIGAPRLLRAPSSLEVQRTPYGKGDKGFECEKNGVRWK